MRHMIAGVVGRMPGKVNIHRGAHQAGIIKDERGYDPQRGFVGGILMLTVPFAPEIFAKFLQPGGWGPEYADILAHYDHLAAMLIHGEDLPQASNRITLHSDKTDAYGLPVPVVHYEEHANTARLRDYALARGRAVYEALGAEAVYEMVNVFPATHNMGTARMGTDPRSSVCNQWGQTHDVDNLFVSDGSLFTSAGCENPTLTIVALVLRQAEHIASQIQAGKL
jgi:hypothetical protein